MSTAIPQSALGVDAAQRPSFFFWLSVLLLSFLLIGFAPTLYLRAFVEAEPIPGYVHAHGIVLTSWYVWLVVQTYMVRTGRTATHRRLGLIGAVIGAAVVFAGPMATLGAAARLRAAGFDWDTDMSALPFLGVEGVPMLSFASQVVWANFVSIAVFAGLLAAAILLRRTPQAHKRLMVLASIAIVGPVGIRTRRRSSTGLSTMSTEGFRRILTRSTILVVSTSLVPASIAGAHHSFATHYDASRSTQLSGVVARFDFRSPHSFIFVDVANTDGGVTQYEVELHSVPVLTRLGFSADIFQPGDRITVNAWPNRSPTNPLVFGIGVITADGVALGEFPPIPTVRSAFLSASGAQRVQGRWRAPRPPEPTSFERPMSLTPAGARAVREYDPAKSPANRCEPYNVPSAFLTPYQFDIRLTEREAIVLHEAYGITRRVPLGPTAQRVEPTGVFGTARARIEGNDLVIESSSYPPSGWGLAIAVDENGLGADIPSSEQKTLVERFSVSDDSLKLTLRYTLNDPAYLTRSLSGSTTLDRVDDDSPIYDFECELDSAERFSRDP